MRQPVAEKIQQFHRHGRSARFEGLLELDNFFSQCLMLRFVLLVKRISMRLHQNLLIREVTLGISDQVAECGAQTLFSLACRHRGVQLFGELEQSFVLAIDVRVANAVGLAPLEQAHNLDIGGLGDFH
jgi:hypothetical protein